MKTARTVEFTAKAFKRLFRQDSRINCMITKGLPPDAELVAAGFDAGYQRIETTWLSGQWPDDGSPWFLPEAVNYTCEHCGAPRMQDPESGTLLEE